MNKYAISDLHGRYDLYEKVCEYLKPDDIVYFLGDACDRGPDGWKLLKAIYNNPQWNYLMGNHEHMLMEAMKEYLHIENFYYDNPIELCIYNGGLETLNGWIGEGAPEEWIQKLSALPYYETLRLSESEITILCHSGYTPGKKGVLDIFFVDEAEQYLWNREHMYDKWPESSGNIYMIIHGHTPLKSPEVLFYADRHKIDIDLASYNSGVTCLLNLDSLLPIYFEI